jgi:hypothetical protein
VASRSYDFAGASGSIAGDGFTQMQTTTLNRDGSGHGIHSAAGPSADDAMAFDNTNTYSADQFSTFSMPTYSTGGGTPSPEPVVRAAGTGATRSCYFPDVSGTSIRINKYVNNVITNLASATASWAGADTPYIQATGTGASTLIVVKRSASGATIVSHSGDTARSSGSPGPGLWASSAGILTIDDWQGGDIGGATVQAPLMANLARPFNGIIGRTAIALRSPFRPPAAIAAAGTPVTFTPSAPVSTWTAPDPVLSTAGVTLSPTAAASTWVAGTPTLTVGALSLTPAAATSTWTVPAPSLSPGALSLTPTAATSSWVVPAPVLSAGGVSLAPAASVSTWIAGAATLTPGTLSLAPTAPVSTWTAGTASLGGGSQLTPSAAASTWVAGTATLSAGALALSPSAPSRAWVSGAPSFTPGGLALAPTAPASTWTVPAPVLAAGAVTLSPAAAARSWASAAASLNTGPLALSTNVAASAWHVGVAHFGPAVSLDWIVIGLFTDVGPRVSLAAADPRVTLFDASPTVALNNQGPTVALSPLEFPS